MSGKSDKKFRNLTVRPGSSARLYQRDPADKLKLEKDDVKALLDDRLEKLEKFQYRLYAEHKQALLVVLQGMDTSGKDGVVRHIFSGVNPQGCRVVSFKKPSEEEASHDFLWRVHANIPSKGMIGIFNRSHYEDILVNFAHKLLPKETLRLRCRQINDFERYLFENGVTTLKFFLHISRKEQGQRLKDRLKEGSKHWKYNKADELERKLWKKYMSAYEETLTQCSTGWAPWYVIPSDHKWVRNAAISQVLTETLEKMDPRIPR